MTAITRLAPPARRTLIRAGMLASDYAQDRLRTEFLLAEAAGRIRGPVEFLLQRASDVRRVGLAGEDAAR